MLEPDPFVPSDREEAVFETMGDLEVRVGGYGWKRIAEVAWEVGAWTTSTSKAEGGRMKTPRS